MTGQATPLTTDDVVLIEPPKRHWYQQPAVWITFVVGAALGVIVTR